MMTGTAASKTEQFAWLIAGMFILMALAQPDQARGAPLATAHSEPAHRFVRPQTFRTPTRATEYYQTIWGVDNLLVRSTASSNLIRFSYRVTNPARASVLGDKAATPFLIDPRSRAVLQIPSLEQVGKLRQAGQPPEAGKEYWMVFSNKGNLVRPGDHVSVVIGTFHADGLMVE